MLEVGPNLHIRAITSKYIMDHSYSGESVCQVCESTFQKVKKGYVRVHINSKIPKHTRTVAQVLQSLGIVIDGVDGYMCYDCLTSLKIISNCENEK